MRICARAISLLLAGIFFVVTIGRAAGDANVAAKAKRPRRTVAVLELRAGATGIPDLADRLAAILRSETSHEILDPDDARRIVGAKVDEQIATCAGEPRCTAEIGRKLDVDEVVLVAVSEFGDLILAIQLVDTKSGKVLGRVADSLPPDAEPDDDTLTGYLKRLLPPADFLRFGTIRVSTNVRDALVQVNGKPEGRTPLKPLTVPAPSTVDIKVSKAGYADFKARIDVLPDGTVEVRPVLTKKDTGGPWYTTWWVWAIAGTVAVGALAVGLILAQPDPSSVPVIVEF